MSRQEMVIFDHSEWRLRRLVEDYADGIISLDQLTASVQGWINHVRYSNSVGLRKAVLRRAVIPKQQKRKQP